MDEEHIYIEGEEGPLFLMEACASGRIDEAEFLIESGADVNEIDEIEGDVTPLMVSCGATRGPYADEETLVKLATFLIESGAELNAKDRNGKIALDYAIENGFGSLVSKLLGSMIGV